LGHRFLSEAWFDEVDRIREELGPIDVPPELRDVKLNLEVTEGPDGFTVQAHFGDGAVSRGFVDAPTRIKLPYEVARKVLVDRNPSAGMQAFMSGQIQIDGDVSRLMPLQSMGSVSSPGVSKLVERITAITE